MKSLILVVLISCAFSHEMVPTYPKLLPSHIDGIYKTKMKMFNKRSDVEFYEIGVFDKDFKPVNFVSSYKIFNIKYLGHVAFDVYIRKQDILRATYICSKSKLRTDKSNRTAVSSKICSKIK